MDSTLTIDGRSIKFADPRAAYGTYKLVAAIISSGNSETLVIDTTEGGDYRTRAVLHITGTTSLSASLAYSPVEDIAPSLDAHGTDSLIEKYGSDQ